MAYSIWATEDDNPITSYVGGHEHGMWTMYGRFYTWNPTSGRKI
jgi:hypothetical protein